MLNSLAVTSSVRAGSAAPAARVGASMPASMALTGRPVHLPYATRGRFTQAGMALANHCLFNNIDTNTKVWPLGPEDGSTG